MEMAASMSLRASFSLPNSCCFTLSSSRHLGGPLPSLCLASRTNSPALTSLPFPFEGHQFFIEPLKQHKFSLAAAVGDTTAAPNDSTLEQVSSSVLSDGISTAEGSKEKDIGDVNGKEDKIFSDENMIKVYDKLIGIFMVDKPTPKEWRRLIAFSRTWDDTRPHFFKRCEERAAAEDNPEMKANLLRFRRKLKEVDEDVQRHSELLEEIKGVPSESEIGALVAKRRKDFTKEFFLHLDNVAASYHDNPEEQKALTQLRAMCLAAVEAYEDASETVEAINAAELKLQDIINSPSLLDACRKIDSLAEKNELDPTLVLTINKAWSAAKETNLMRDEAKDILYHLYTVAVGNLQRLMPKEVRILKYLLTIDDPELRLSTLKDAFSPGVELEGKTADGLYTEPQALYNWIKLVVDAYYQSKGNTLIQEAKDLMNPKVIKRMEELQKIIQDKFM